MENGLWEQASKHDDSKMASQLVMGLVLELEFSVWTSSSWDWTKLE